MIQQDSSDPTGVSGDPEADKPALARARDRKANAALQMRLAGATWDEIAEVSGYPTARAAVVAVEGALERELQDTGSKEQMRSMAAKRLERLLRSVWAKAIDPNHPDHLAAVTKARELVGQHSKLYGLDAPTEVTVHNPTAEELENWVATVISHQSPELEQANILGIDVVEGEWADATE